MVFKRHDGIGQDREIIRLRRRPLFMALTLAAGILILLMVSALLLRERKGSLLVTADQPGVIVLNGSLTPTPTGKLIKGLRPDTYSVSVSKAGFIAQPRLQIIQLRPGRTTKLSFTLAPAPLELEKEEIAQPKPEEKTSILPALKGSEQKEQIRAHLPLKGLPDTSAATLTIQESPQKTTASAQDSSLRGSLRVVTRPANGKIFVDDIFKGIGEVSLQDLALGEVVVLYGELEGYRAPKAQKIFLSPEQPSAEVEGIYLPLIYIAAYLDASGRVIAQKSSLALGYAFGESETHPDPVIGPGVKFLEGNRAFAWEMGYAFSNRNPAGQDFIEMTFELPENWDGVKPLELRLYGCASDRHYPFAAGNKTSIDVFVNDRLVQKELEPRYRLGKSGSTDYDPIAVNSHLQLGQNRIRIQTSADSRCYYYLWKIVLL